MKIDRSKLRKTQSDVVSVVELRVCIIFREVLYEKLNSMYNISSENLYVLRRP